MSDSTRKPQLPTFYVTQDEFDSATPKERENMVVFEGILAPPDRYTPAETSGE